MKTDLGASLVPPAAAAFIRALHATLRVRHARAATIDALNRDGKNYVYAFWHGQILQMIYARFARPATVMISQHRDGELIASTIRRFGIEAARGSTTRGGSEALRVMLKAAWAGRVIIFTPDGPRGPRHSVQPGVVRAAQLAGIPIIPGALIAERRKQLASWDRFEIPYPFTRVLYLYGDPISIPRALDFDQFEKARADVERRMVALVEEGERDFDRLWREGSTV
ncbi:MAG TPA: lysophospholipid acyltransferase family protein [Thermoanaerobaculia bacterium]|nr:lysophospholipid acyltransferase family protein [Thermoanaerobaculia bacterium]